MSDISEMGQEFERLFSEQALMSPPPELPLDELPITLRAHILEYPDILAEALKEIAKELSDTGWRIANEIRHPGDFIIQQIHSKDL